MVRIGIGSNGVLRYVYVLVTVETDIIFTCIAVRLAVIDAGETRIGSLLVLANCHAGICKVREFEMSRLGMRYEAEI